MAKITLLDDNQNPYDVELPAFALDSSAQQMVSLLKKLAGDSKEDTKETEKLKKGIEDTVKNLEKGNKASEGASKELLALLEKTRKQIEENGLEQDPKALEDYNRAIAKGEKTWDKSYQYLRGFGVGLVSVTSAVAIGLFNAVTNAGETLNELTRSGVGFGDAQGSSIDALAKLSTAGIDASQFLTNFSRAAAVLGVNKIADMSVAFDELNKSGMNLGMSLEESAERYGEELDTRARLGILNGISSAQIAKETQQTMKTQQKFAQALGVSTDELRAFTNSLVTDTNILSGSLLRFNKSTQSQMVAGLKEFGTIMAGMGGEEGKGIAQAMVEASAGGALGFSNSLVAMTAVLPRLQQTTVQLSNAMRNGTLTQEGAQKMAMNFSQELGNLSQGEKERIFAMERAGVEGATEMANAVRAFTASAARIDELKLNPDNVQKGTNALNNIISKIMGTFEAFRYSFLSGLGSIGDLGPALEKAQKIIVSSLSGLFGETSGDIKDLGKSLGEKLPYYIQKMSEGLASFIDYIPTMITNVTNFAKGFFSVMKVLGVVLAPVILAFKLLGVAINVLAFFLTPVTMLFKGIANLVGGFLQMIGVADSGSEALGQFTGVVVLAIGALKLYTALQGKGIAKMMSGFGEMAKKFTGFSMKGFKDKLGGFMGGRGGGAGKGAQKQIMDGAGASGKAAGGMKAFGGGFTAMMKGIVAGLKVLGKAAMNPMVWAGLGLITVAVIALATALRIAAPAIEAMGKVILNVMQGVGAVIESVGKGIAAIVTAIGSVVLKVFEGIGVVIVSVGKSIQAVFQGIGSIIMGIGNAIAGIFTAIGKAAMFVGKGISLIFEGMASLGNSFTGFIKELGSLSGTQLLGAAAGLTAVGAALVAMTAGSVISQIAKGFANLFSDDPIDQFIRLGKVAPNITEMADVMDNMGDTVDKFTDAVAKIDGNFVASQMNVIRDAFITFGEALDQISFTDLFKMAAMGLIGGKLTGGASEEQAPVTGPATGTSPIIKKAGKLGDNFTANYSQRDMLAKDPELYKNFQGERKAREEELIAGGSSKQRASLTAEREALKKYAPQIQKAGAGSFKDADGNPVKFDDAGNVIQQPTAGGSSQELATSDNSADILSALNKQNSLLAQLVRQNQTIADNI